MAQKIKGITVEIGGNTLGLQKALGAAKRESNSLKSELKSVNAALKLDPTNIDLLKQRQELYKKSIDQTKEKLKSLQMAKDKADEDMAKGTEINEKQYRELQREISFTESSLKDLEKQSEKANKEFSLLGQSSEKIEAGMKKASQAVGAVTIAVGTAAVKASLDFDDAMAKVSTIAEENEVPLDTMKNQILELSKETGIAAADIANNVYDAISAGQKTGDAVNFVTNSTKLAKAGFADSGQALDLLTTILNAYGMEAEKAGEVSDILIQTQNKGKVTVGELSSSMGKVIPTAKSFNVSLEQVATGYTIMTSKGIKSAETTTYMNSMLNELGKSGTKASEIIKDKTGKSFQDLMAEGKSLGDVLKILDDNAKENNQSLADMFGSAEAGKAALTLLSDGSEAFNSSLAEMNNSTGATQKAFDKMQTPAERFRKQLNELKIKAIELGDKLQPVFKIVQNLFGFIIKNSDKVIKLVGAIGVGLLTWNIVSMVQRVIKAIQGMTTAIQMAKTAQAAFNATMASSGFGLIAAAIGTVVTALVLFAQKSDEAKTETELLTEKVKEDTNAWNDLKKAQDEQLETNLSEISYAKELYDELTKLTDEHGNVVDRKDRVKFITDELNKIMPDTIKYIEEEGKAYIETTDNISDLIEKKKAQAIIDSEYDLYVKALKERNEKEEEVARLSLERKQKETELEVAQEEYKTNKFNIFAYDRMMKAQEEYYKTKDNYFKSKETLNDYYKTISKYENDYKILASGNMEEIKKLNDGYITNVKNVTNTTLVEMEEQLSIEKEKLAIMKEDYNNHVDGVTSKMVEAQEKTVKQLEENLQSATSTLHEGGKKTIESIISGIEENSPAVGTTLIDVFNKAKISLSDFIKGKDFQKDCVSITGFIIDGLNKGIELKAPSLRNTLQHAVGSTRLGVVKQEDINSPSRRWEKEIGQYLLPGVARGVEKTQPVLNRALSRAMDKARKAMYSDESTSLGIPTKVLTSIHGTTSQSLQSVSGPVININGTKVFNMDDVNKLGAALVKYIKRSGG